MFSSIILTILVVVILLIGLITFCVIIYGGKYGREFDKCCEEELKKREKEEIR